MFSREHEYTSFVVTLPITRNFKLAYGEGQVQLNYEFTESNRKVVSQLLEEDNEKFMENVQMLVLEAGPRLQHITELSDQVLETERRFLQDDNLGILENFF